MLRQCLDESDEDFDGDDTIMKRCFSVNMENLEDVDCTATPKSSQDYLRMVVAERRQLSSIVVAENLYEKMQLTHQTVVVRQEVKSNYPECKFALQPEHVEVVLQQFEALQSRIPLMKQASRAKESVGAAKLKSPNAEASLNAFLRNDNGQLKEPTASLLLILNSHLVHVVFQNLFESLEQCKTFDQRSLSWFYSLLAIMEKPLHPDTCSLLRDFARYCKSYRMERYADNPREKLAVALSVLVCLIANHYGQKDLGD